MKRKRGFMDGYKTYDTSEGYGNKFKWKKTFYQRMGFEEAQQILHNTNERPEDVLGITESFYTLEFLKERFRSLIMIHHPDRGGIKEVAQRIIAAYTILKEKFGIK